MKRPASPCIGPSQAERRLKSAIGQTRRTVSVDCAVWATDISDVSLPLVRPNGKGIMELETLDSSDTCIAAHSVSSFQKCRRWAVTTIISFSALVIGCGDDDANKIGRSDPKKPSPSASVTGNNPISSPANLADSDEYPDNPMDGISMLQAKHSGKVLGDQLWKAGRYYASHDLELAKAFALAAPAGSIGQQALTGLSHGIDLKHAPDYANFLISQTPTLGAALTTGAIEDLLDRWARHDFNAAWSFVNNASGASKEQVAAWCAAAIGAGPETSVINAVADIKDTAVRSLVTQSSPYIDLMIRRGNYEVFEDLNGDLQKPQVKANILRAVDNSSNHSRVISALLETNAPGASAIASNAISNWISRDTNTGLTYLESLKQPELLGSVIEQSWRSIAKFDPVAAAAWIKRIPDQNKSERLLQQLNSRSASNP